METKEILICLLIVLGLLLSTIYVLKLFLSDSKLKKSNKPIYKTSKHKSIIAYSDDDTYADSVWKEMLRNPK